jgi:hypothetical protein
VVIPEETVMNTPAHVARLSPVVRVAVATLAGAAGGLAAFAAGWSLLVGTAPTLLGWLVGGVAAAFVGSEVGCRTAVRLTDDPPSPSPPTHATPLAFPFDPADSQPGTDWRDRVRAAVPPGNGPGR